MPGGRIVRILRSLLDNHRNIVQKILLLILELGYFLVKKNSQNF